MAYADICGNNLIDYGYSSRAAMLGSCQGRIDSAVNPVVITGIPGAMDIYPWSYPTIGSTVAIKTSGQIEFLSRYRLFFWSKGYKNI